MSFIAQPMGGTESLFSLVFSIWHYRIISNLFYFHRVRVFAPFTPFLTEHMYQNLKHLVDWSKKEEETNKRSVHAFTEQFYRSNLLVRFTGQKMSKKNGYSFLPIKFTSSFMVKNCICTFYVKEFYLFIKRNFCWVKNTNHKKVLENLMVKIGQ